MALIAGSFRFIDMCHINLTDFSTDACVRRELPRLQEAMAVLHDVRECGEPGTADWLRDPIPPGVDLSPAQLDNLITDLAAIMRRTPEARDGRLLGDDGEAIGPVLL